MFGRQEKSDYLAVSWATFKVGWNGEGGGGMQSLSLFYDTQRLGLILRKLCQTDSGYPDTR